MPLLNVSSCHEGFGDRPVFVYPLVKHFFQRVRRQTAGDLCLRPPVESAVGAPDSIE